MQEVNSLVLVVVRDILTDCEAIYSTQQDTGGCVSRERMSEYVRTIEGERWWSDVTTGV